LKFPGTSVPIFHNHTALDDEFDDSEAPMLSSIVVDEDDIDFHIDWFIENSISIFMVLAGNSIRISYLQFIIKLSFEIRLLKMSFLKPLIYLRPTVKLWCAINDAAISL
jgi:hypothetical protein